MQNVRFRIGEKPSTLRNSKKVVTPVKTGVQNLCNYLNRLDSGLRRNDGGSGFRLEFILQIPDQVRDRLDAGPE